MKRFALIGFPALSLATLATVAACSSMDSGALSSYNSGGSGDWGTGGGNSSGGVGQEPPSEYLPAAPTDGDAGADAAPFACDGLDQDSPVTLYLSADDSNSMGSPVYVRELLRQGGVPWPESIRTYEFLNYYRIQYPAPPAGQLSILPQLEQSPIAGEMNMQLGIRSFDAVKPRRPITVTLVLDTSGSMAGPAMEREIATVKAIAQSLAAGDIVNAVTWNTENNVLLAGHKVQGPSDPGLLDLAASLSASGGTDLSSGLAKGYELANQNFGADRMNRVILISDGGANVGITDADLIGEQSEKADKEAIYLVGVGTGPAGNYSDALMNIVTDRGRGAYVYLDSVEEAQRMFVDRFDETMEIAARGVQIELTLPWYMRMHRFHGEEYSTDSKEIEPQHLAPGDAMIFNQVIKACDASIVNPDDPITVVARWKTPLTYVAQETKVTMTLGEMLAAGKEQLQKGKAIVAVAEAFKVGSAEALKSAHDELSKVDPSGTDPELSELAELVTKHPSYQAP
ncbi:vWA domain-containing protein [Polyangium aurulentum]|uniref:vWA domain-containing protein n=1 Tax=Polyangium aurulentum TaxID=2567896 RepID=UPI001F16088C|nr:VWA domain-containing protein [Polyangium aurulentum]